MSEKFAVVINISNKDLRIPELKKILPGGGLQERYVLPYNIAIKYKQFLHPVAIIDPDHQDEPIKENKNKTVKKKKTIKKKVVKKKKKPLAGVRISEDKCEAKAKWSERIKKYQNKETKNEIQAVSKRQESPEISN